VLRIAQSRTDARPLFKQPAKKPQQIGKAVQVHNDNSVNLFP
jgi:hypothetical protein